MVLIPGHIFGGGFQRVGVDVDAQHKARAQHGSADAQHGLWVRARRGGGGGESAAGRRAGQRGGGSAGGRASEQAAQQAGGPTGAWQRRTVPQPRSMAVFPSNSPYTLAACVHVRQGGGLAHTSSAGRRSQPPGCAAGARGRLAVYSRRDARCAPVGYCSSSILGVWKGAMSCSGGGTLSGGLGEGRLQVRRRAVARLHERLELFELHRARLSETGAVSSGDVTVTCDVAWIGEHTRPLVGASLF